MTAMKPEISPLKHRAVIFDLDGVLTDTAGVHAKAWKKMFDAFLKTRKTVNGDLLAPFDLEKDYLTYVDGKPRIEGIRSFLKSRDIELAVGSPNDSKDQETLWGLGNKKNEMFNKELGEKGVDTYPTTIELIRKLKQDGIRVGLISSSKNCRPILKKTHLIGLFDVIIDGVDAQEQEIVGKPAPDIFLKAAEVLSVKPSEAVVVEDAISGVQAGSEGEFDLVIGVDRSNQAQALLDNGADVVVKDLGQVTIGKEFPKIPSALKALTQIKKGIEGKKPIFFFDYDGTLSPIVSRPDLAVMSESMKETLQAFASRYTVAILSGRDLQDVKKMVQLPSLYYAGSHGFDIEGPNGEHYESEQGKIFLSALEEAEKELREKIPTIEGAWVERKKFAIAIHFRQTSPEKERDVEAIVDKIHSHHATLRKKLGKKIFELQPNIDWDKGKALWYLMDLLKFDVDQTAPFFFGDDVTDEDGFRALKGSGIGISVHETPKVTDAIYQLVDVNEMEIFLKKWMSGD